MVTIDLFTDARLKPQWEWHYQPRADRWSLTEHPGFLRLKAYLREAATLLTERDDSHAEVLLKRAGSDTDAAGTVADRPAPAVAGRSLPGRTVG